MTVRELRIWPTQSDPGADDPDPAFEVVDVSGEGDTLMIGTLEDCQREYPQATIRREP
jgi:hypothetical protein